MSLIWIISKICDPTINYHGILTRSPPSKTQGTPRWWFITSTKYSNLAKQLIFDARVVTSLCKYATEIVPIVVTSERQREVKAWYSEEPMPTRICSSSLESDCSYMDWLETLATLLISTGTESLYVLDDPETIISCWYVIFYVCRNIEVLSTWFPCGEKCFKVWIPTVKSAYTINTNLI